MHSSPHRATQSIVKPGLPLPLVLLLTTALLCYFLMAAPDPHFYLSSPDAGVQTAGGQQIAMGEYPFIDWRTTYGPLRFYLSYLAAMLGGGRVGSELVLCAFGNALTYAFMFCCAIRVSQRAALSLLVTALAIVLMPPFTKFYIAFCPLLALLQACRFVEKPSLARLACMAGAVVIAASYRLDVGLWAALPCIIALKLEAKRFSLWFFLVAILAISAPWWLYLLSRGSLLEYLLESTYYGIGLAEGLKLPYPRFDASLSWHAGSNLAALSFPCAYAATALAIGVVIWRRQDLPNATRKYLALVVSLTASALLQTMHRSDYSHLRQGLTGLYLLLAILLPLVWLDSRTTHTAPVRRSMRVTTALVAGFSLLALSLTIAWGASGSSLQTPTAQRWHDWVELYSQDTGTFVKRMHDRFPQDTNAAVVARLRDVLPPGTRFFAAPYLTNLYTMSGRGFASRQLYLAPGYFSDTDGQKRMIASLVDQGCPPVVELVGGGYDGLVSRTSRTIAPLFFDFIDIHYVADADADFPRPFKLWWRSSNVACSLDR